MADVTKNSNLTREEDYNNNTSKRLMKFCMQLVHHSAWKTQRAFVCGSYVELPVCDTVGRQFNVNNDALDIDRMLYNTSRFAFHRSASIPETYSGSVIRIYTDDLHAGYVRLIREQNDKDLQLSDLHTLDHDEMIHGPAVMKSYRNYILKNKYSLSDVETDKYASSRLNVGSLDTVLAVHSPYWPEEAGEWITRRRCHGFPSKSVFNRAVRYGCDFVQVSHKRNRYATGIYVHVDNNEWRFSFSQAELLLIKSWTMAQRIVYETLWVINKKIASSKLCSYYFKTLMFWACEEKPTQFWIDSNLIHSVRELLIYTMSCLNTRFCANYFIPGNNMLDHFAGIDLSDEIRAVWRMLKSFENISKLIDTCRRCEIRSAITMYRIESPDWFKRFFDIYMWINNPFDNYIKIFREDVSSNLKDSLYKELSHIYRGLYFQRKAMHCLDDKQLYFLRSERHLLLASNLWKSQKRGVMNESGYLFMKSLNLYCINGDSSSSTVNEECNPVKLAIQRTSEARKSISLPTDEHKCLMYPTKQENQEEMQKIEIKIYRVCTLDSSIESVQVLQGWMGRSPTVNISWFLAKAYLANLYYTTQCDGSLTTKPCDDIIDVYQQSYLNEQIAERTFPVVLSTQFTSIYDTAIQELLGFYSLCLYVFDASSRSVYLGVCPVQFALYLKVCTASEHQFSDMIAEKFSCNYQEHVHVCRCDRKVCNGSLLLTKVLSLLVRKRQLIDKRRP